jgi:hypothetical protein
MKSFEEFINESNETTEEWYKETWDERKFNKIINEYPKIEITGHLPSKGEIRLSGPKKDIENLFQELAK